MGRFSGGQLTLDLNELIFKTDGIPVSAIVPRLITISDPLGAIVLVLVCIGLCMCLGFSIYFFVNRHEKVIKKTSPFFCQLILLGIAMCLTSQIIWEITQSTLTCIFKIWLLAIGFGLIMGNLLAKTYRIWKIFNNIRVTSLVIKDTDLLKFSAIVVIIEIILLSVYTFTSGLPRPVNLQSLSDSLLKIVECQVPSSLVQIGMTITLLVFNGLLIIGGVIIAYLTRNVDSAFNESKYIAITMYMYLLVSIILLPLYYTAGDSSSSVSRQFVLRALAVLASMYFTLFCLFVPKILIVEEERRKAKRAAREQETTDRSTTRRRIQSTMSRNSTGGDSSMTGRQQGLYTRGLHGTTGDVSSTTGAGMEDSSRMARRAARQQTDSLLSTTGPIIDSSTTSPMTGGSGTETGRLKASDDLLGGMMKGNPKKKE